MLNEYPDVMTVKQLSQALHIGMNSAYALLNSRMIGSRRIGKKYIIPKSCVIDYLQSARYMIEKP